MILGILFLIGAAALVFLAWRQLRALRSGDWVREGDTRILVSGAAGQEPRLVLEARGAAVFGPVPATWDPPRGMTGVPPPVSRSGTYRVLGLVRLDGKDALGAGDALVLAAEDGGRPILLQGLAATGSGSAGGIGIGKTRLTQLLAVVGDPAGLRVEVVRRRVTRGGWGPQQERRHRGRT